MDYVKTDALGGLLTSDSRDARFAMDAHVHDEFVIAAYLRGAKAVTAPGWRGVARPGDVLIVPPGVAHTATSEGGEGCHYRALYPTGDQVAAALGTPWAELAPSAAVLRLFPADAGGRELGERIVAALDEAEGDLHELAVVELLVDLFARPAQARAECPPQKLEQVKAHMDADPAEVVTLAQLAAIAQTTPEHCNRAFRSAYGLSPFQYLRARRAGLARDMIVQGEALADAAAATGFADQSHMTRWFKRIFGAPPSVFMPDQ